MFIYIIILSQRPPNLAADEMQKMRIGRVLSETLGPKCETRNIYRPKSGWYHWSVTRQQHTFKRLARRWMMRFVSLSASADRWGRLQVRELTQSHTLCAWYDAPFAGAASFLFRTPSSSIVGLIETWESDSKGIFNKRAPQSGAFVWQKKNHHNPNSVIKSDAWMQSRPKVVSFSIVCYWMIFMFKRTIFQHV